MLTKELLDEEDEAATAEDRAAALAEDQMMRTKAAEERVRRERVWATKYKTEWTEWERVGLLLVVPIYFGDNPPFDFDEFLREVGRCPAPGMRVTRRDKTLPYQPGNLRWSRPRRQRVEPAGLNAQQAADYLGISLRTLYNNRRHIQSMPGFRKLMFDRKVLEEVLHSPRFRSRRSSDKRRSRNTTN